MDACGIPIPNTEVIVLGKNSSIGGAETGVGSVKTDVNGFFSIDYVSKSSILKLKARTFSSSSSSQIILEDIPAKKHIDFNKINSSVIYNLYIKFQVNNPYTSSDTLKINIYGGTQPVYMEINGPFTSGIVDSVMNQTLINFPYRYNEKPHISYQYSFTKYGISFNAKKDINTCANNEILFVID